MIIGSYFGEIEIIFKIKRCHTTVAAEPSELLTLSKQIYESIIVKDFFEIHEEIKFIAGVRHEKNMEAEKFLNQTLTNNKERLKKRGSIFKNNKKEYSLSKALLEIKKYKKVIEQVIKRRCKSYDNFLNSKGVIPAIMNNLLNSEEPIVNVTKDFNSRVSMQSIQSINMFNKNKVGSTRTRSDNKQQTIFNWSSDTSDENGDTKSKKEQKAVEDANKSKLAFYSKIIAANKKNQNARRPSFILNQIVQGKVGFKEEQEAIKEESTEKSQDSQSEVNDSEESLKVKKTISNIIKHKPKRKSVDQSSHINMPFTNSFRNIKRNQTMKSNVKPITEVLINSSNQGMTHSGSINLKNDKRERRAKNNTTSGLVSLAGNINEFCDNQKFTLDNLTKIVGELKNTVKEFTN